MDEKQRNKMGNKIYRQGARKEYDICEKLRKEGFELAQRTAGSHSPVDIIAINRKLKIIKLIQSKRTIEETMSFIDEKLKAKIEEENRDLNGLFNVEFEVR